MILLGASDVSIDAKERRVWGARGQPQAFGATLICTGIVLERTNTEPEFTPQGASSLEDPNNYGHVDVGCGELCR